MVESTADRTGAALATALYREVQAGGPEQGFRFMMSKLQQYSKEGNQWGVTTVENVLGLRGKGWERSAELIERIGHVTVVSAEDALKFQLNMTLLGAELDNFTTAIGNELLPVFADMTRQLTTWMQTPEGKQFQKSIVDTAKSLQNLPWEDISKSVRATLGGIGTLFGEAKKTFATDLEDIKKAMDLYDEFIRRSENLAKRGDAAKEELKKDPNTPRWLPDFNMLKGLLGGGSKSTRPDANTPMRFSGSSGGESDGNTDFSSVQRRTQTTEDLNDQMRDVTDEVRRLNDLLRGGGDVAVTPGGGAGGMGPTGSGGGGVYESGGGGFMGGGGGAPRSRFGVGGQGVGTSGGTAGGGVKPASIGSAFGPDAGKFSPVGDLTTPSGEMKVGEGDSAGLAAARAKIVEQLRSDPAMMDRFQGLVSVEVGSQGPEAIHAKTETVLNRMASRGESVDDTIKSGYYGQNPTYRKPTEAFLKQFNPAFDAAARGSNKARYATGNWSGRPGGGLGGPKGYYTGSFGGEQFSVQSRDADFIADIKRRDSATAKTGGAGSKTAIDNLRVAQTSEIDLRGLTGNDPMRPDRVPVAGTGDGPGFRTANNAEVEKYVGFQRAIQGLSPEFQSRIMAAYKDMPEDIKKSFVINEGWRSKEYQSYLYNSRSGRGMVAQPGHSRHEGGGEFGQGTAVDIDSGQAREWLRKNSGKYGIEDLAGDAPHFQIARGDDRKFFDPKNPQLLPIPGQSKTNITTLATKRTDDDDATRKIIDAGLINSMSSATMRGKASIDIDVGGAGKTADASDSDKGLFNTPRSKAAPQMPNTVTNTPSDKSSTSDEE
jgi:hypothetical protein